MQKENQLKSCCKKIMSFHDAPLPSSRSVSMRDIRGAKDASLYPGFARAASTGMTSEAGGFTLIELLVVVLIIGILAAVALPQYQKAVEKSRATQALTLLRATANAVQTFYLANGTWPRSFDDLDIDISWTGNTPWCHTDFVTSTRSNEDWSLQFYDREDLDDFDLYMGRISGPYQGAGFIITDLRVGKISCAERIDDGLLFQKNAGDYCEKIMKGTLTDTWSSMRNYSLP